MQAISGQYVARAGQLVECESLPLEISAFVGRFHSGIMCSLNSEI